MNEAQATVLGHRECVVWVSHRPDVLDDDFAVVNRVVNRVVDGAQVGVGVARARAPRGRACAAV